MVYVIMTDLFLTDWGPGAGKKAKIIYECETDQDALIIAYNAHLRRDRADIVTTYIKPHFNPEEFHVEVRSKNKNNWYNEGGANVEDKPIATLYCGNAFYSLELFKIEYGIEDYAIIKFSNEKKKKRLKIYNGNYIKISGVKYFMNEFIRC